MADDVTFRPETLPRAEAPPALARVVGRLVRAFSPEAIVLFGSYAKGTQHPRSDVDLLVIAELFGSPASHLRRAHHLAADSFPPVDVVFATPSEIADAARAPSPFLHSILGRGRLLYCRTDA